MWGRGGLREYIGNGMSCFFRLAVCFCSNTKGNQNGRSVPRLLQEKRFISKLYLPLVDNYGSNLQITTSNIFQTAFTAAPRNQLARF